MQPSPPQAPAPAAPAPPEPLPATEPKLRALLSELIERKTAAEQQAVAARDAYARAAAHRDACVEQLAAYDTLDAEISLHTVTALRDGVAPDSGGFEGQLVARDRVRLAYRMAESALATLGVELDNADAATTAVNKEIDRTGWALLSHHAAGLPAHRQRLLDDAERVLLRLRAFDQSAPRGTELSAILRECLFDDAKASGHHTAFADDLEYWTAALAALRLDPTATIPEI